MTNDKTLAGLGARWCLQPDYDFGIRRRRNSVGARQKKTTESRRAHQTPSRGRRRALCAYRRAPF